MPYSEIKESEKYRPLEVQVKAYRSEIIAGCIPINVAGVLVLVYDEGDAEEVQVAVLLKQNEYKVIGFSD